MRILQICNKFPYPPKDGGVIATYRMLQGLYNSGNTLTVATINTSKHYSNPDKLPESVSKLADFHDILLDTSIRPKDALYNLMFSDLPYTATRFISETFSVLLTKILEKQSFDIIQLEGLYVCPYIPLIRKYSNACIAYRAHNVEFEIWERLYKETNFLPKRFYLKNLTNRIRQFELSMLNQYDVILPITQRDADFYNSIGNTQPYYVVPTGIQAESYKPIQNTNEVTSIFHIGGLDWAPNQQGIIWFIQKCWPHLLQEFPNLRFKIAGRNAPQWFIDNITVKGVDFVGEVPDARRFMEENSIMVVPLLAGSGMRIKIIEGLAYGKAIVSSSVGAEGIYAEHNHEISIANTPNEFIDNLRFLIKNNEKRNAIEKNAVTFVAEKFDNNKIIAGLTDFYTKQIC